MDIWKPGEGEETKIGKCTKKTKWYFPYLDMKMLWSDLGRLAFRAYSKPGQAIQYVNKGSCHRRSCLEAIPHGVLKRLGKLTSTTPGGLEETTHQTIYKIYPNHFKALKEAKLIPCPGINKLTKMRDLWRRNTRDLRTKNKKNKKYDRRNVYFVQGHSNLFSKLPEPLHHTIEKTFKANHIPWIRTRMAYRKFRNLGELL